MLYVLCFMSITQIKQILHQYRLAPLKQLGQHFLINEGALEQIIRFANIKKNDTIIEVGAGLGTLTERLAKKAKKVIAIEIDKGFSKILKERCRGYANVEIIQGDILTFTPPVGVTYNIVGNLPYNLSSLIIEKFLQKEEQEPRKFLITVQQEFAERMLAKPRSMNRLSLLVQYYAKPVIVANFPPHYFWPQPKVSSVLVKIQVKNRGMLNRAKERRLWEVIKKAFNQPRKMLKNTIPESVYTRFATKRPSELSLDGWIKLSSYQ